MHCYHASLCALLNYHHKPDFTASDLPVNQDKASPAHASNLICLQVMRLVMTAGAAVVRGNHDDSALSAYNKLQRRQATIQVLLMPSAQAVPLSTADSASCWLRPCGNQNTHHKTGLLQKIMQWFFAPPSISGQHD